MCLASFRPSATCPNVTHLISALHYLRHVFTLYFSAVTPFSACCPRASSLTYLHLGHLERSETADGAAAFSCEVSQQFRGDASSMLGRSLHSLSRNRVLRVLLLSCCHYDGTHSLQVAHPPRCFSDRVSLRIRANMVLSALLPETKRPTQS
eukprot:m.658867 g.658867  ORF g.658867 m.658867 type:complete len:151 (-) comp58442_c0_seq15:222-674(-)